MKTLEQLLKGQDLNAFKTVERVLKGQPLDAVTSVIVEAWRTQGGEVGELDMEGYRMDLHYAINQLQKALNASISD